MPLAAPDLDNRNFDQMVEESLRRARENCPQWTDLSPGDPGVVLLELFAFLTEAMIYRLNRLPEKAYIEFLRLIGVKLNPPVAAAVKLRFTFPKPLERALEIPRGTRATLNRSGASGGDSPIFTTLTTAVVPKGETSVEVTAYHCDIVEAELIGKGTGLAGLSLSVKRAPVVAPTSDELELMIGVETAPEETLDRARAVQYDGKTYRIWDEVENFGSLGERRFVYAVDRVTGAITFAPAVQLQDENGRLAAAAQALAEKPAENREIRVWYFSGGGASGNVAADTLTVLKTQVAGASVTNPAAAAGGRDAETLQNALVRGPQELHSLQRAVTADDFELLALRSSGAIARAKAFTKAMLWSHAAPGTIEVLLVPNVPEQQRPAGALTLAALRSQETEEARAVIRRALDERRPLGTVCLVNWVHYKEIGVTARAAIHRGADAESVKARVLKRLYQTISPLPSSLPTKGWKFGEPLRASHIYDILLAERDVSYVENVRLNLKEVPEKDVASLAADHFQANTWYSATGADLFRSMNDGEGWEIVSRFPDEQIELVRTNKIKAGLLAVVTRLPEKGSRLYFSADCGETWRNLAQTDFTINDLSWTWRDGLPLMILATDEGLYSLSLQAETSPVQILVDPQKPKLGFYAVAASTDIRGTFYIAAAARNLGGVFLSAQGGKSESFTNIGLQGEDVRVLEMQQDAVRTFLWAGVTVAGNEAGKGAFRWELQGSEMPHQAAEFRKGWEGGSCHGLAFKDALVFAGTHEKGVLWLDTSKGEAASWHAPLLEGGLPIRDAERIFFPIDAVASRSGQDFVLIGGKRGVFRSGDDGTNYESVSRKVFADKVTIPPTWLFCSGEHEIEIVSGE